ncbi:MAG: Sec-independent protein translocase subunit TatA [Actinomycetes bacterium]
MPSLGGPEIILLLLVVLLLFGAKRLPDTARGLGRSLRIFKSEMKAANDDDAEGKAPEQIVAKADEVTSTPPVVDPAPTETKPDPAER